MQVSFPQKQSIQNAHRRLRRGILSAWSIYALLVAGLCTALVINTLWLSAVRLDAQRCAEASALAAGSAVLSDAMLRPRQTDTEQTWRSELGRLAAVQMSRQYQRAYAIPALTSEDIWYGQSTPAGEIAPWQPRPFRRGAGTSPGIPDFITAGYGGPQADGLSRHRLALYLPGLTGVREAALGVQATAWIQHAPIGFQPSENLPVPMIPYVIPDTADGSDQRSWAWLIEQGHGRDDYSWAPESHRIASGPDGLPELKLLLTADASTVACGNLIPVSVTGKPATVVQLADWTRNGFSTEDLANVPGRRLMFPQACDLSPCAHGQLQSVVRGLGDIAGRAVIVALSEPAPDATAGAATSAAADDNDSKKSSTVVQLTRPAAARVMAVRVLSKDQVEVILQPCVLTTATAIMNPGRTADLNRYIYQVRLAN